MTINYENFPNTTWAQFEMCNDDRRTAFEDMARRLFSEEYLKGKIPHSNPNNPGVEIIPVLEPKDNNGSKQRMISFQAKYFENRIDYTQIKHSMMQVIKHYKNKLDLIYLFCNKTITTTSKSYVEIEELLETAGIKIYPISNKEMLDLVAKHLDIAKYFFLPRILPGSLYVNTIYSNIVISKESDNQYYSYSAEHPQVIDKKLIQSFVMEKIEVCKSLLLELKLDNLEIELDKIFKYNLKEVFGADKLLFYKLISDIYKGIEIDLNTIEITSQDKQELLWLIDYYKNPIPIGAYTFASHCIECQIMVLDKMFSSQLWDSIESLCVEIMADGSCEIIDSVAKYYGLSLYNLQKFSAATEVLINLYQKNQKENILLYSIFAEMMKINMLWRKGNFEDRDRLVELIKQLDSMKGIKQYESNEIVVAMVYLETSCNLGYEEKGYLENAIEKYQNYSDAVKNEPNLKFLYAFCLELNGCIEAATSIYEELDWENNFGISCRYMICKLIKKEYNQVVEIYEKSLNSHTKLRSLYLSALYYLDRVSYEEKLKESLNEFEDNIEVIIDIAFGVYDVTFLQQYIVPCIKKHLDLSDELYNHIQKEELLSILSRAEEIELVLKVIKMVPEKNKLNAFIVKEIYNATYSISSRKYNERDKNLNKSENLDATEIIADLFLDANVARREFLQIKYLCSGAKGKDISMLKYAKEFFEITRDKGMARNIIAMLYERNETSHMAYDPYISVLINSKNPKDCMAVAVAMLRIGKYEEADLYAYKSLYYLNDIEDYDIFSKYFAYFFQNQTKYYDEVKIKRVSGSCIVTLETNGSRERTKSQIIMLCLDSESEFSNSNNTSMDIKHITSSNSLYRKLQGSALNQVITINGINYRITNIQSRSSFAISFIFKKICANHDKFDGIFAVLKTEKTKDFIEQIEAITNNDEQMEGLINLYHFKDSNIGLPLDLLIGGEYDRYIDILTMLLYKKDQALYTGFPTHENDDNTKLIPTLSTLVLLSSMNLLNVLEKKKSKLLIPISYIAFFDERYSKAKETNLISPGKLVNIDRKLTLIENDDTQIEIWERIVDFCSECEKIEITDEERISFSIGEDINGEQIIAMAKLNLIHLDSFILAKKENATLLCDDLFFRKLAAYGKIKNINFASYLQTYVDIDCAIPVIIELSKTNYLYIPIIARNNEEELELRKNMFNGQLKEKYYSEMLKMYAEARKKIINDLFGDIEDSK